MGFLSKFQWFTTFGNAENAVPASELGIRFLSYVWVFSAVGSRKIRGLESLHFRFPVYKCKSFLGQIFLKRCKRCVAL